MNKKIQVKIDKDGSWGIILPGEHEPYMLYSSKEEAVRIGKNKSEELHAELIVKEI
jgi:hypothetical protein